jgi:hypothetical protein
MFGGATHATMRACLTAVGPPPATPVSTTAASFGAPSGAGAGARGRPPHAAGGRSESEALADRGKQILLQVSGTRAKWDRAKWDRGARSYRQRRAAGG